MPSHVLGILSLVFLAAALVALYVHHLAGPWRWIYVVGAVVALYFNVFVGIVQAFMKVPSCSRWRRPSPSRHSWSRSSW